MCSFHSKFVFLLALNILFFELTAGITTGVTPNSGTTKSVSFENGSAPDYYQIRNVDSGIQVQDQKHVPSKLDPIYSSTNFKSLPHKKGKADPRTGISVDKTPPDLQFGLAFTVPFVSLSTDRLLSTVSGHRGYNSLSDIMSILKLNVGGLVLAAVVGLAALLFVPAVFAGKGQGFGGLSNLIQNTFMPGFLDTMLPGFGGLNKPIGFGQYDSNYNDPYGNNLPYGLNRKDNDVRSRSVNDNQNNGTSVFNQITNVVGDYLGQAQSCALYTMCARGREEKMASTASRPNSGGHRDGRKTKLSTLDHAIEVIQGVSNDVPGLDQFKEAYNFGRSGKIECAAKFKDCNVEATSQIKNYINNIGEYIFS